MVNKPETLTLKDKQLIWHPCTTWKPEEFNIPIVRGEREYLYEQNGKKYIDAISSWWVNIHGHSHPYIAKKVYEQFLILEHVIFAGITHPKAVELAERLLLRLPQNQYKIFFSDNGSTAVEIALKIAVQFRKNKNQKHCRFVAYEDAYHGDTFGAMAVSGKSIFTSAFSDMLFEVIKIPTPVAKNAELSLSILKNLLKNQEVTAIIFEPLVLGAGGMLMYEPEILDEIISVCHQHNVLCIADEVMTGFGRTGSFFACDKLANKPDIFCMSKGITGGVMPLGATSVSREVFSAFEFDLPEQTFWHGHSYTANPLACAAACASLDLFESENTIHKITEINKWFLQKSDEIKSEHIKNMRVTGTIFAAELNTKEKTSYTNPIKKRVYDFFLKNEILIRPLGNILYFLPPYCISYENTEKMFFTLNEFLNSKNMSSL